MPSAVLLLFALLFLFPNKIDAQSERNLDSILSIKHRAYNYINGVAKLSLIKESVFDSNQVLVIQHRYHYRKVDTGFAIRTHYHYTYNPQTKQGAYYTENLVHSSQPNKKYSKQESSFKSYDHKHKREWVKLYKKDSKSLLRQTQKTFDKNGYATHTQTTNYNSSPPNIVTENVKRNAAGNIIYWESFDDDGDTKTQARAYEAQYINDTLLLYSSGYLYFNWNETSNKYNSKNKLQKKVISVGTRQSNGKIKRNDQITVTYKEGKPYKSVEKKLKKTVKTILFVYEEGKEIQRITTPDKSYEEVKTYIYLDSAKQFLTLYTESLEGKPFQRSEIEYDEKTTKIMRYTEHEYRNNNKDWKTVKNYNNRGNLTKISFYIAGVLNKEDIYEYVYQPAANQEQQD